MNNQNIQLNIGDEIGFVNLSNNSDEADKIFFFAVAEIATRDGERAYRYAYPDGEISRSAIRQSELASHVVKIRKTTIETIEPVKTRSICIADRRQEFTEGLARGKDSRLEVYADWDRDAFVVVNREKNTEYRVRLEVIDGELHAECECRDLLKLWLNKAVDFCLFGFRKVENSCHNPERGLSADVFDR